MGVEDGSDHVQRVSVAIPREVHGCSQVLEARACRYDLKFAAGRRGLSCDQLARSQLPSYLAPDGPRVFR